MEKRNGSPEGKEEIRRRHLRLRGEMTEREAAEKSRIICHKLLSESWYETAEVIFGYYPLGNEVDCRRVLMQALSDGKRVVLPRTMLTPGCAMDFYEVTSLKQVEEGNFHVMEPIASCPLFFPEENQAAGCGRAAVLVPGVAFDHSGNRLGYGKGYYDRYFARYPALLRLGLAYEHQIIEWLAASETDVKMNLIYSEVAKWNC